LQGFKLELSIGLAEWTPGQTLDQVLTAADQAMFAAKAAHKGAVR
jgi:PleD family two-component response regulator